MDDMTNSVSSAYVGVDVGGTNTRIGLFESLDSPQCRMITKFPTQERYEEQIERIVRGIMGTEDMQGVTIAGTGCSIAGQLARDGRSLVVAPNLLSYVRKPFAQDIENRCNCPVRLAHDPVCGLLAEKRFGDLHHYERCAYLTVSTGTGAAIQLSKGKSVLTSSIEIGHQILDGNTRVCLCGQVGCLETYTGGRQITLREGYSPAEITDSAFWETFSDKLAIGLVNLTMLTRVEVVALSGAIVLNRLSLLAQVQQRVNALLCNTKLTLKVATLGENAPLVGAAQLLAVPESTILH
ncbi:MAG TPA: ROK family protein [Ktedonobacteraceae bacterium]|nr:ROK family protein [Ktedonobacteraceae bacterium]